MAGSAPPPPGPPGTPADVVLRLARAGAGQRARVGSDLNQAQVVPEYDAATKSYLYETAPTALKQLFGSPLAQKGSFARGRDGERLVTSGWGDPPPPGAGSTSYNQAIEFAAALGETVFAAADGIVQFVGVQASAGGVPVPGVHADESAQTILGSSNVVVASSAQGNVGFGGIYVAVQHDGDFQGYQTEYHRLSTVSVASGQAVTMGQAIGTVGGAGGASGWARQNFVLRFQIALASGGIRALVNPTALVPNVWPGHADSTNTSEASSVLVPIIGPVGSQMAIARAANLVIALNRNTALENKGVAETKADMSAHAAKTAQNIAVESCAAQAAFNGFQDPGSVVQNPMAFNFTTGLWTPDGRPV